jgi:hypothetical protein
MFEGPEAGPPLLFLLVLPRKWATPSVAVFDGWASRMQTQGAVAEDLNHRRQRSDKVIPLCPLWLRFGEASSPHFRFPQLDVTCDLAPRSKRADHRQGGSGIRLSAKKSPKSFVIKILTSKPLELKILQTLFADPAPVAASQGGWGRGYHRFH